MVNKVLIYVLLLLPFHALGKVVPDKPMDRRWVQDYANVLDSDQELYLLQKLKTYYDSTSTEIVIVTEESLDGDDAFDYSYRLAQKWGIGKQGKDNGILVYIATLDGKIFIQVGQGAEGALPDIYAKRVVENQLKPNFLNKQYGKGLNEATDVIIAHLEGEFVPDEVPVDGEIPLVFIIIIIVIVIILFSRGGNNGQTYDHKRSGSRGSRPPIWIGSGGLGGGGTSSGGFGGGFGGGSFGGGGAGGSW